MTMHPQAPPAVDRRFSARLIFTAALMFASTAAHAADSFTCTYVQNPKTPPLKLTSDGMMQFGKEKPVKADGFKMDDADTQFFIARPDGQHFIGFDQLTGKGTDSVENSGKHASLPITCKKN